MPKLDRKQVEHLKEKLSTAQYDICFRSGTEPPFSGELTFEKGEGTYTCVVCATPLLSSKTKFFSKSGWPSFDAPLEGALEEHEDRSLGMIRTEVLCATCGAHLGHVFDDGPTATGKRYCVNSLALEFHKSNG